MHRKSGSRRYGHVGHQLGALLEVLAIILLDGSSLVLVHKRAESFYRNSRIRRSIVQEDRSESGIRFLGTTRHRGTPLAVLPLHQLGVSRDIALRRIIHERHWVIGIKLTTLDGLLNTSDDCALLIPLALSRKNQVISILGMPTQRIWDLVHRSRAWTV
jgi:hypothetical protein